MKPSLILCVILFLGVAAVEARAQQEGSQLNSLAVASARPEAQRTPTLVLVNETVAAPQPAKNATPDSGKAQAANVKDVAGKQAPKTPATATQPTENAPPNPVVLSPAYSIPQPAAPIAHGADTTGNSAYDHLVKQAAARHGVDPNLVMAVMRQESGFNSRARSYKGASGLMQLMPATARRFGVGNIYDPAQNIEGGTRYLRFLLDMFNGDVELALAGYNAGEGAVLKYNYQVPRYRETQNYVRSISARYGRSKHQAARPAQNLATAAPAAPAAAAFSGGVSTRLSNNY
jgi:soluble lytic murein transglycosylase-like protein